MNIFFGTKKLGKVDNESTSNSKYPDRAVVTLEEKRGPGKTRRILFNEKAMELLLMTAGEVQTVVFGVLSADNDYQKKILVSNSNNINDDGLTTYKVSKNKVSYNDSKEKGKSISSSVLTQEILEFLDKEEDLQHEFELSPFVEMNDSELDVFCFEHISNDVSSEEKTDETLETVSSDKNETELIEVIESDKEHNCQEEIAIEDFNEKEEEE